MKSSVVNSVALRTIGKVGQRRQVVLPQAICDQLNLHLGDPVEFVVVDGYIVVKPKKLVDADSVLSSTDAERVRRGEKQLQRGKGKPWTKVKKARKL
ncbi:MAG: AbrB/MazE/SpoVT family DNA-binding domain-containing protein [Patescibacteria group bacterium]